MKDAKGHGSDAHGGAAHQTGVKALDVASDLKALYDKWQAQGVRNFSTDNPAEGRIKLHDLVVPKEQRGRGIGHTFMDELTRLADKHGRTVSLTPAQRDDKMGTTSTSRLRRFYGAHGFVRNRGRTTDFTISDSMYRKARK